MQWVGYLPAQVQQDINVFAGAGQYVFISTAATYEKPPSHWLVTERTPQSNPYWDYGRQKIACERLLIEAGDRSGFPYTIVRPSLTYGVSQIPVVIGSWDKPFTIVDRMRRGAPIIVPGDGTSLWTITHNSDFAKGLLGLLGNPAAIGQDFHITSDEALAWDQIYSLVGAAAGAAPNILHVPSDAIVAADPSELGSLFGDKIYSTVFDNSKLRGVVPGYRATVPFAKGSPRRSHGSTPTPTAKLSTKPPTGAGTTSPPSTRMLWPGCAERAARLWARPSRSGRALWRHLPGLQARRYVLPVVKRGGVRGHLAGGRRGQSASWHARGFSAGLEPGCQHSSARSSQAARPAQADGGRARGRG